MAYIIFVTGGARSGKSDYALKRAEALEGSAVFIATCPVIDEETAERIRKHREARDPAKWSVIEEPIRLEKALESGVKYDVILVDCLTLWINNLLYEAEQTGERIEEEAIAGLCRHLLDACARINATVCFVTNEVGMGLVPEHKISRVYRDLVGRCNQIIAGAADEVVFMVSGIPSKIK